MKTFDFDVSSSHVSINISIVRFLVGKTLKVVIHVPVYGNKTCMNNEL